MGKVIKKVVKVVTSVFNVLAGDDKPPEAPRAEAPKAMPTPDDEAMARARKKSIAAIVNRQGRASTILSDNSDTLGV